MKDTRRIFEKFGQAVKIRRVLTTLKADFQQQAGKAQKKTRRRKPAATRTDPAR